MRHTYWALHATERETQECTVVRGEDATLVRIDAEFESLLQEPSDAGHNTLPCTLGLDQDDKIIGIAGKAMAALLQLLVQVVNHDGLGGG